jgi:hypothetical protein
MNATTRFLGRSSVHLVHFWKTLLGLFEYAGLEPVRLEAADIDRDLRYGRT